MSFESEYELFESDRQLAGHQRLLGEHHKQAPLAKNS